ncbi:MAG TPA: acyl-CoA dehydrogenase [Candidatus Eisenbacteria bacterium]|nr:acyl-CoA dehydrogenase [Candidatus Eisenbacteria bacterium]
MNFHLTEEQEMLRAMAREFADGEIAPIAARMDEEGRIPEDLRKKLRDQNFFSLLIPEEYGGAGIDQVAYAVILEELSRASAAVAITVSVHNSVGAAPIQVFGTEAQKKKWLPLLAREALGAFALTEPGSGSDAAALITKADRQGDDYVLNGTKTFITNGAYADLFLVMARTSKEQKHRGITAFLIEKDRPGLRVGKTIHKMGLLASDTTELMLEECRVPVENRLGDEGHGFRVAMQALDGGRIGVAAQALGIAQASLDAAARYAKERVQFDRTIAEFQAVQWMIADMATEIDAARLLMLRAAWLKDNGLPCGPQASMAKLLASRMARVSADYAVQIHGGYGYTKEFAVERYYRDAKVTELYEGTSEIQRIVIAGSILHPKERKKTP